MGASSANSAISYSDEYDVQVDLGNWKKVSFSILLDNLIEAEDDPDDTNDMQEDFGVSDTQKELDESKVKEKLYKINMQDDLEGNEPQKYSGRTSPKTISMRSTK